MYKNETAAMRNKVLPLTIFILFFWGQSNGQGTWTQKASFPGIGRGDAFSFSLGTKGYVCSGTDGNYQLQNDVWEYDATTDTWTQKANFAGPARMQTVYFSIGTKGYVGTGYGIASAFYKDFWEYNSITDTWTQKANFGGTGRWNAVGFSIGGKGYIGTGRDGTTTNYKNKDFWEYDTLTDTWTRKADFGGIGRAFAVGFSIGAKGYIGSGIDSLGNKLDDFWEYDPALDTWTQIANFGGGDRMDIDGANFIIGNNVYLGTGANGNNYYNDFWKYDQSNNLWSQIPSLPALPRIGMSNFSINNIGYVGIGFYNNGSTYTGLNDLWSFNPHGEGINEPNIQNSIIIFPNPLTTQTTLQAHEIFKDAILTIYNTYGQQIKQIKNISGQTIILYRDNLESGLYFIQVTQDNKTFMTEKLLITDN